MHFGLWQWVINTNMFCTELTFTVFLQCRQSHRLEQRKVNCFLQMSIPKLRGTTSLLISKWTQALMYEYYQSYFVLLVYCPLSFILCLKALADMVWDIYQFKLSGFYNFSASSYFLIYEVEKCVEILGLVLKKAV